MGLLGDDLGIEQRHAAGSAEQELSVRVLPGGAEMEFVALETVIGVEIRKGPFPRIQAAEAVGGGHPEVAVAVLQDAGHHVTRQSVGFRPGEAGAPVAGAGRDPFARPDPYPSVGRFVQTVHACLEGGVSHIVGQEFPERGVIAHGTVERAQPDRSAPVDQQGAHPLDEVFGDGSEHFLPAGVENGHPGAVGTGIQAVVSSVIGEANHIVRPDASLAGERPEAAARSVGEQAVQIGGDPQHPVPVVGERHDGIVGEPRILRREKGAASILLHAEKAAAVGPDPQGPVGRIPDDGGGAGRVRARLRIRAGGQVAEPVHGLRDDEHAGLERTGPDIALAVFHEGMDFPAGNVVEDIREPGFPDPVGGDVIDQQSARLGPEEERLLAGPLVRAVRKEGDDLARPGVRIPGGADKARRGLMDIESCHGPDEDVPAGIFRESADFRTVQGDAAGVEGRRVHDRETSGFAGEPDPSLRILEQGIDERGGKVPVQEVPPSVLERMGLRVQDIDAVLGGRHPDFRGGGAGADLDDGGDVLGGAGGCGIPEIEMPERVLVRIEDLQAHGGSRPERPPPVLEDGEDVVAGDGVGIAALETEGREVHAVETGDPVLGGDPDKAAGILIDVMHQGAGKPGFGTVQTGCLRPGRRENQYQK